MIAADGLVLDCVARICNGAIKFRERASRPPEVHRAYAVHNLPASMPDALAFAKAKPFGFQRWILECLGVSPLDIKPGPDQGMDGRLSFRDGGGRSKEIVFSVKTGHVSPEHARSLKSIVADRRAQIGVLVSVKAPTKEIRREAAIEPYRASNDDLYPANQILTVRDIFDGRGVECPDDTAARRFKIRLNPAKAGLRAEPKPQRLQFG